MLFDTHAHYDDDKFDEDRLQVIEKAHEKGVGYMLNAASCLASARESISLARRFDYVYAAVGIHPHNAGEADADSLGQLRSLARESKVVAIGEIGLDYYYDFSPRELQKSRFAEQLRLARDLGLPVIIHSRDSHEDVMNILIRENAKETGGVFHCYTGSVEMAKVLLDNNFYISFGGAVTFKNARKAVEAAAFVPLDRLLLETDCPYMTPHPYRGQRNDSGYIGLVAQKIAEIRKAAFEDIASITTENAKRLFGIR